MRRALVFCLGLAVIVPAGVAFAQTPTPPACATATPTPSPTPPWCAIPAENSLPPGTPTPEPTPTLIWGDACQLPPSPTATPTPTPSLPGDLHLFSSWGNSLCGNPLQWDSRAPGSWKIALNCHPPYGSGIVSWEGTIGGSLQKWDGSCGSARVYLQVGEDVWEFSANGGCSWEENVSGVLYTNPTPSALGVWWVGDGSHYALLNFRTGSTTPTPTPIPICEDGGEISSDFVEFSPPYLVPGQCYTMLPSTEIDIPSFVDEIFGHDIRVGLPGIEVCEKVVSMRLRIGRVDVVELLGWIAGAVAVALAIRIVRS